MQILFANRAGHHLGYFYPEPMNNPKLNSDDLKLNEKLFPVEDQSEKRER